VTSGNLEPIAVARPLALAAIGLAVTACVAPHAARRLRAQVGEIRLQVERIESQQKRNLESVRALEPPAPRPEAMTPAVNTAAPPPAEAGEGPGEELYRRGYALHQRGDHAAAERALQSFLRAHPGSALADDARYWIGETFFARGLYARAIVEFREVIDRHPAGGRAAHAQYKVALCHLRLGQAEDARRALRQVVDSYPASDVAPLAQRRLDGS
jgi:tol-pal system protein YbgF